MIAFRGLWQCLRHLQYCRRVKYRLWRLQSHHAQLTNTDRDLIQGRDWLKPLAYSLTYNVQDHLTPSITHKSAKQINLSSRQRIPLPKCNAETFQSLQAQNLWHWHLHARHSRFPTSQVHTLTLSRPIFLLSVLLIFLYYTMSSDDSRSIPVPAAPPRDFHYKYTVQKGVFLQSEDSTDDTKFDFVRPIAAQHHPSTT